jgi:hypothetical protein
VRETRGLSGSTSIRTSRSAAAIISRSLPARMLQASGSGTTIGCHAIAAKQRRGEPVRTLPLPTRQYVLLCSPSFGTHGKALARPGSLQSRVARRGALVPRSHRSGRSQPAGLGRRVFVFSFVGRAGPLILLFMLALLGRGFWRLPRKSGGPPLFTPSLKVQWDVTHDNSGF